MVLLDPRYLLIVGPALIFALWAQARVKSVFKKYSKVANASGLSGADAARQMLEGQGVRVVDSEEEAKAQEGAVVILPVRGFLSDHYDPAKRVLRLSPQVFNGRSISAVGVACHEAGHALQHASGYAALELRTLLVPTASFGSWLAIPLVFLGSILGAFGLVMLGLVLFTLIVLFQIVTLPVEFNASSRAKDALIQLGIIRFVPERKAVAAVLNAAALTYVAAAVASIATLIYYLSFLLGVRD